MIEYDVRHALTTSLAVVLALLANQYLAFSQEGWLVVTTFVVSQTTRGTPLKQALLYFLMIILMASLVPAANGLQNRILDVALGALIGIVVSQFILPVKVFPEFAAGVLPLMRAMQDYLQNVRHKEAANVSEVHVIEALGVKNKHFPEWVYEVGFNRGLRGGYRFFLIYLERISELVFSMQYQLNTLSPAPLLPEMENVLEKNAELLSILIAYFSEGKHITSEADFTSDMVELEKALNRLVPGSLELLDMSLDYVVLAALTRDLKDMRDVLLKLTLALPATH